MSVTGADAVITADLNPNVGSRKLSKGCSLVFKGGLLSRHGNMTDRSAPEAVCRFPKEEAAQEPGVCHVWPNAALPPLWKLSDESLCS